MAAPPFPLTPAPAYFSHITFPDRNGIFYTPSPTVTCTLDKNGATGYTVEDTFGVYGTIGATVSSGSFTGVSLTVTAPGGGWLPGWYRIRLTGPSTDLVFGTSYGASNFCVVVANAGYPTANVASENGGGESRDAVMKGILGIGSSRLTIGNANAPTTGVDSIAQVNADITRHWSTQYRPDTVRPRPLLTNFPGGTVDSIVVAGTSGSYLKVYCKDGTIDGGSVFVKSGPGTTGSKITVYFPNNTTVVETYDNLASSAAATTAINVNGNSGGPSNYIYVFSYGATSAATAGPTAIGNSYRNGVITTVQALYPIGVTRYEGPANEPDLTSLETVQQMRVFQGSIHAGNAAAVAIGPCPVSINPVTWKTFLDGGGGSYCDEFSAHPYGAVANGDLNLGRISIQGWINQLASYGFGSKPIWSTEPTEGIISRFGVLHPRASRIPLLMTLLWEQYGMPAEQNQVWYDVSHGFWSFPSWLENSDGSLQPYAVLYRTLSAERFGKTHHHRIDFGLQHANHVFLGSVYRGGDGSGVAVVMAQSYIPSASVTFTVVGTTSALTAVDSWGNTSSLSQSSGKVVLPVSDTPTYLRLPSGVSVYVSDLNAGWGSNPSISPAAQGILSGGSVTVKELCDNQFAQGNSGYSGSAGVAQSGVGLTGSNADTADLLWNSTVSISQVIVFCTSPYQLGSALVTFKVQTTANGGSTWTDRETVDVSGVTTSQFFGTDFQNGGTSRETSWPEQWIFDVPLGGSVSVNGVRIRATATSQGGEPDLASNTAGGQGAGAQEISISEIVVPSASTPTQFSNPTATVVGALSGLVGYWRCNETTGATIASTINTPAIDATASAPYLRNQAGGTGDGSSSVLMPAGSSGAFTGISSNFAVGDTMMAGCSFFGAPSGTYSLMAQQSLSGGFPVNWSIRMVNGVIQFLGPSGSTPIASSSATANANSWNRVIITKATSTTKVYLNGADVTSAGTNQTLGSQNYPLTLGGGLGFPYHAPVQDFIFGSAAISSGSVAADWAALPIQTTPVNTVVPTIEGTAVTTGQVSAIHGQWTAHPTKFTFQWQSATTSGGSYSNISGATRSDYLPVSGDLGHFLRVNVAAGNTAGTASAVSSAIVGPVTGAIVNITPPVISGNAIVGGTLTCSTGTWAGTPSTFTYQWQSSGDGVNWSDIPGATASTLLLDGTEDLLFVRCGVIAS